MHTPVHSLQCGLIQGDAFTGIGFVVKLGARVCAISHFRFASLAVSSAVMSLTLEATQYGILTRLNGKCYIVEMEVPIEHTSKAAKFDKELFTFPLPMLPTLANGCDVEKTQKREHLSASSRSPSSNPGRLCFSNHLPIKRQ